MGRLRAARTVSLLVRAHTAPRTYLPVGAGARLYAFTSNPAEDYCREGHAVAVLQDIVTAFQNGTIASFR